MDKKMPEIRFREFSENWEQRKFNEVLKVNSGRDYKHLDSGDIPVYGTGGYMLSVNEKLSDRDGIGIGRKGTIDKPQYLKAPYWTVDTLFYMTTLKDNDLIFFFFLAQNVNWKRMDESTGVPSLSKATIEKVVQFVPSSKEQRKIGLFFKQLDDTIALHQQKLEALQQLKKSFLQKIFLQSQGKTPQIRFVNFHEEWEHRKFKDFSTKVGKKNSCDKDYPAFSISNKDGLVSQTEQFDGSRLDDLEKSSYKIVYPNEFAYNPARINVGSIAFNDLGQTVLVSSLYVVFKLDFQINNEFILQYIKSIEFNKEVKRNTEGSVREYLFFENFKNIKFPFIKNLHEQIKIGIFFKTFDDSINLYQNKLDKLQLIKHSLLQKMFI